ncbi:MAG: addiction module protein [Tepidisphaerales bacterium]
MPMTREQVLREAMSLAPDDREAVAEELLMSLDEKETSRLQTIWLAEARRRDADYSAGKIKASSIDAALNRIMARRRP